MSSTNNPHLLRSQPFDHHPTRDWFSLSKINVNSQGQLRYPYTAPTPSKICSFCTPIQTLPLYQTVQKREEFYARSLSALQPSGHRVAQDGMKSDTEISATLTNKYEHEGRTT